MSSKLMCGNMGVGPQRPEDVPPANVDRMVVIWTDWQPYLHSYGLLCGGPYTEGIHRHAGGMKSKKADLFLRFALYLYLIAGRARHIYVFRSNALHWPHCPTQRFASEESSLRRLGLGAHRLSHGWPTPRMETTIVGG